MKKLLLAAAAALSLVTTHPAYAGDSFDIMGVGYSKCSQYLSMARQKGVMTDLMFASWAQGFMSAANMAAKMNDKPTRNLNAISLEAEMIQLHSYCTQHQSDRYMDGVLDLLGNLPTNQNDGD